MNLLTKYNIFNYRILTETKQSDTIGMPDLPPPAMNSSFSEETMCKNQSYSIFNFKIPIRPLRHVFRHYAAEAVPFYVRFFEIA